jgi:cytochrome c553
MNKINQLLLVSLMALSASAMAGNVAAGKEKAKACVQCHGADGNSASADFPKLAGQHADYLIKTMQGYKNGTRKNPVMSPMAANLTQRDMEDLAAYFSRQQGLSTFR